MACACARCGVPIRKYKQTPYCAKCVVIAKVCSWCGAPIAAFNKRGICLTCQRPEKE